jgi:hypothetical protein
MISERLSSCAWPKQALLSMRGFFISGLAMSRSVTFESRTFGVDPMLLLERQQAEAANEAKRASELEANAPAIGRPILTLKRGTAAERAKCWSAAREAAEALFDVPIPPQPVREL